MYTWLAISVAFLIFCAIDWVWYYGETRNLEQLRSRDSCVGWGVFSTVAALCGIVVREINKF